MIDISGAVQVTYIELLEQAARLMASGWVAVRITSIDGNAQVGETCTFYARVRRDDSIECLLVREVER